MAVGDNIVWQNTVQQGENRFSIPAGLLSPGLYQVCLQAPGRPYTRDIWIVAKGTMSASD